MHRRDRMEASNAAEVFEGRIGMYKKAKCLDMQNEAQPTPMNRGVLKKLSY